MLDIAPIIDLAGTTARSLTIATVSARDLKDLLIQGKPSLRGLQLQVSNLAEKIIEAKLAQVEMESALRTLERDLEKLEAFDIEAVRYQPMSTGAGAIVYALKDEHRTREPFHCICPACYAESKKSILQPALDHTNAIRCLRCHAEFRVSPRVRVLTGGDLQ